MVSMIAWLTLGFIAGMGVGFVAGLTLSRADESQPARAADSRNQGLPGFPSRRVIVMDEPESSTPELRPASRRQRVPSRMIGME